MTTRRQFLTNAVAAAAALTITGKTPARTPARQFTPEEVDSIYKRVVREADDLPDGEQHPELHHAIVALYAVLNAADALLVAHEGKADPCACRCEHCEEISNQANILEQFAQRLKGHTRPAGLVCRAELHNAHQQQARRAGILTAVSRPLPVTAAEPYRCDPELFHCFIGLSAFSDHADALLVRHQAEEDGACDCDLCADLCGQLHIARYFESYFDSYVSPDNAAEEYRRQLDRAAEARREAADKPGRRTVRTLKPYGGRVE